VVDIEASGPPAVTDAAITVGCDVAEALAAHHPDRVAALHLTDVSQLHYLADPPTDLSEAEQAYISLGEHWQATEGGYTREQATKPHTLAVAVGDSPAGLAAWIVEKLHGWTDCDGEVESVFTRDELLTWVSAYWFDGCIGTSFRPYSGGASKGVAPPGHPHGIHYLSQGPGQRPPRVRRPLLHRAFLARVRSRRPLRRLGTTR
jgi:pimeloyl-ACP methyl ester carboxylesterase